MKVPLTGYMIAFGDFNADRATDVFILDTVNGVQQIDVILMTKDSQKGATRIPLVTNITNSVSGVIVCDFDGDSIIDLIMYHGSKGNYSAEVAYGNKDRNSVQPPQSITNGFTLTFPPLHLDSNADMIADLFGQLSNNQSMIIIYGKQNKKFAYELLQPNWKSQMDSVLYSKVVDVNQDGKPDVVLIGREKDKLVVTTFVRDSIGGGYTMGFTFSSTNGTSLIGQGVIGDFRMNGQLMMVIPMCRDAACNDSYVVYCSLVSNGFGACKESALNVRFVPGVTRMSLAVPEITPMSCGDLHLIGRPECVVVVRAVDVTEGISVRLMTYNKDNSTFGVTNIEGAARLYDGVNQVAVFDLEEDGIPDLLTTRQEGPSGQITPLLHETSNDQYFIKVMVLNGLCNSPPTCPGSLLPFGMPLPGIVVSYSTEAADGGPQSATAALNPDSGYSSLQLPYALFGLGAFANYVEKLTVTLPSANVTRRHSLSFIVPKTQIVIIPSPLDEPSKWTNKLFLEPFRNRKVIYVAAALLGTFLIVAIIVCILQYLEVRVDRLEKQQDSQKFHFDAM